MTLEWDRKALDFLIKGYDISYGARSIKHEVERRVVNQIAVAHEYNLIEKGSHVLITAELPPEQQDDINLVKSNDEKMEEPNHDNKNSINYVIRLKKVIKTKEGIVYQDINLKINSIGKYYLENQK